LTTLHEEVTYKSLTLKRTLYQELETVEGAPIWAADGVKPGVQRCKDGGNGGL
jgi:hypothetical protein